MLNCFLLFFSILYFVFFFFNDTATTEIYTLSLHDALPICTGDTPGGVANPCCASTTCDHRCHIGAQHEQRVMLHRCSGERAGSSDRVGIATLRLVSGECDVVDIDGRVDFLERLWIDEFGIDAETLHRGDI